MKTMQRKMASSNWLAASLNSKKLVSFPFKHTQIRAWAGRMPKVLNFDQSIRDSQFHRMSAGRSSLAYA